MKKLLIGIIVLLMAGVANAADLQWDYPADWNDLTGYVVYFNEVGDTDTPWSKTLGKNDITQDGTSVTYADIDDKLNLQFNQPYNFYITAYNDSGESGPSNSISYERSGYSPPADSLPPPVVSLPSSGTGLRVSSN